jgi:hypothetical protein
MRLHAERVSGAGDAVAGITGPEWAGQNRTDDHWLVPDPATPGCSSEPKAVARAVELPTVVSMKKGRAVN